MPSAFDAVVSANAYHWIAPADRVARPLQLLAPGGWLAVIELMQVGSDVDGGYFDRVQPIYEAFGDTNHDWHPPSHDTAVPRYVEELADSDDYDEPVLHRVRWDQTYTVAEFGELMLTYSDMRMMPERERGALIQQLLAVVRDEYDGTVTRPLVATLTMAQARIRA
ncbi:MAG: hypothetical protein WBP59_06350 [Ilumatobacteraceae bacterium]